MRKDIEIAKRGRSKEKRYDCPLVTLGLVLNGDGSWYRSQVFSGKIRLSRKRAGYAGRIAANVRYDGGIGCRVDGFVGNPDVKKAGRCYHSDNKIRCRQ